MLECFAERLALDVNDCVGVLVLPVEAATDSEDVLVPFTASRIVDGLSELIVVD